MLEAPESLVSLLEDLRDSLVEPKVTAQIRTGLHEFVCQYKNPQYYLSRCFVSLYPFGRGCPSDKNCPKLSMADYYKFALCLGGGPHARRFQQNSKFIFTAYTMEMKRKIGGAAYLAQRKESDHLIDDVPPTIKDINELLSFLENSDAVRTSELPNVINITDGSYVSNINPEVNIRYSEIEKLIKRIIPYSKSLLGSMTHIAYERGKLMAMIPSSIILNDGSWRLFLTNAPADLYESRFYDVVESPIIESSVESWSARFNKVCDYIYLLPFCNFLTIFYLYQTKSLSEYARMVLLRKHPAVMARLFDKKQDCFWQNLLLGKSRPLGLITDYWRRVEVTLSSLEVI